MIYNIEYRYWICLLVLLFIYCRGVLYMYIYLYFSVMCHLLLLELQQLIHVAKTVQKNIEYRFFQNGIYISALYKAFKLFISVKQIRDCNKQFSNTNTLHLIFLLLHTHIYSYHIFPFAIPAGTAISRLAISFKKKNIDR